MKLSFKFVSRLFALAMFSLIQTICSVGIVSAQTPPQTQSSQRNRIVFQVSEADPAKWNLTLNNVKNVQDDLGVKNVDIEIVAYGPGLAMLKLDSVVSNKIGDAIASGVSVLACENTMKVQKLTRDDMASKLGYVPAGVVQLMTRQQQGWAYIRP